jgi:predicted metallo-beta-lactamase superfamily hydrolase
MKPTLEKLWDEYFSEECGVLETEEEKELVHQSAVAHKSANEMLTREQRERVDKFVDLLNEMHGLSLRQAFCKGCEFTASFLLETLNYLKK